MLQHHFTFNKNTVTKLTFAIVLVSFLLSTFVSTVISGGSFVVCLLVFMGADTSSLVAYIPIVLGTAAIGSVLVQLLYLPLKKVLNR